MALCLLCNKIRKRLCNIVTQKGSVQELAVESKNGFYTRSSGSKLFVKMFPLRD